MSTTAVPKRARPLVYSTPKARERALKLLPRGAVLEVEIARAIRAGDVLAGRDGGKVFGENYVATCRRVPGQLRARPRAWLVIAVDHATARPG